MNEMQTLMQEPEDMNKWLENKRQEFEALKDN